MSGSIHAFTVPKWGLTMERGTLVAWNKAVGDRINPGDEICDFETEKIVNGVESPVGGILRRIVANVGDVMPIGAVMAIIADDAATDAEIDELVEKLQASQAEQASKTGGPSGPQPEYIEVLGQRIRHLIVRGDGDAVVLIHGFGGNLENWMLNHAAWAANGRTVAALDLPGHGESAKQVDHGTLTELSSVVLAYMDLVGIEAAHLVGHSLGAAVCLTIANRARPRVKSLTLIAPAGLGQPVSSEYIGGFVTAETRKELKPVLQMLFADENFVSRQLVDDMLKYKRLEGVTEALGKIAQASIRDAEADQTLREVVGRVPSLILWGSRDAVIPALDSVAANTLGATYHCLPDKGHMLQVEAAAELNQLVEAFLTR